MVDQQLGRRRTRAPTIFSGDLLEDVDLPVLRRVAAGSPSRLDMCCFKRPFDDQRQPRIRREAEAVSTIIEQAEQIRVALIRSPALLLENDANLREDRRLAAALWIDGVAVEVAHSPEVERRATELSALGFAPLDSLHVSYAEAAGARALLTCNDGLLGLGRQHGGLLRTIITNPVDFQQELAT